MVLANMVRLAKAPLSITVIAPDLRGIGLAYSTRNPLHLLNVPARNMSAFAHDNAHFVHWLNGRVESEDFAPRMIYGEYLNSIREHTLAAASNRGIGITWVEASATSITREDEGWRILAGGREVSADQVVIATGNEAKSAFAQLTHPGIVEQPWQLTEAQVKEWGHRPIAMIGTGLTSVDMVLSLRRMGYTGEIAALSRNGILPLPHRVGIAPYTLDKEALFTQPSLLALLRFVRGAIRQHQRAGGDWRAVIDALRPHATTIWQRLSTREQLVFIRRLATMWNSHRHRMAPQIAALMQAEITAGTLKLGTSHHFRAAADGDQLKLAIQWLHDGSALLEPAAILNCTGPELDWARSSQPLLRQMLQQNDVARHSTGLGVMADADYRIGEHLFAIGNPMNGQFWESTAVPELRVQAAHVAELLCRP